MFATRPLARRVLPGLLATGLALVPAAQAATFVVTSTADTAGSTCAATCTLRQAITAANATAAADTINFAIQLPVRGVLLIAPTSPLPTILHPLTIDGYSQNGTRSNTLAEGSNANLRIRIDGAGTSGSGLSVCAANVTIRGLSITRFAQRGIVFGIDSGGISCFGTTTGAVVAGNFIGLHPDGATAAGNGAGVIAVSSPARVGGSALADRNIVSANTSSGILFQSMQLTGSAILNNLIGTDRSGTLARGNVGDGVKIISAQHDVDVGSTAAPNVITNNAKGIVVLGEARGHSLFANRISANAGPGIDLGDNGPTPNDFDDDDNGPNGQQNFPVIGDASRTETGASASMTLDVEHVAAQNYRIALYSSPECDANGFGEGARLLTQQLRGVSSSSESFAMNALFDEPLPIGTALTATATAPDGSTSEFSECFFLDPLPLVVNSTADPGSDGCDAEECTLREAIEAVNASPEDSQNQIGFAIENPATGELLIQPLTPLPTIERSVTIDGYSQDGTSVNTDPVASNAQLRVRVDGELAGSNAKGFTICADNTTIRGLSVTGFSGDGIVFGQQADAILCAADVVGGVVSGSFIGLTTDGGTAAGNSDGVEARKGSMRIGGDSPADRNLLSGNQRAGVSLINSASSGSRIDNNLIGTDRSASEARGNGLGGVMIESNVNDVEVGSTNAPNRVAFNNDGIRIASNAGSGHTLHANHIFANAGEGIDLGDDGVTANDADDADTGPNGHQNVPELDSAERSNLGIRIAGSLDVPVGTSNADYTIALYASVDCDTSGFGEGERYLGATTVNLGDTSANEDFVVDIASGDPLAAGTQITATATAPDGSTSEFSACIAASDPPPGFVVTSTADTDGALCSVDCTLRQAINATNAQPGPDLISFAIPGTGPFVIDPQSPLPILSDPVAIDGYTQLGASPNTLEVGNNAVILIEVGRTSAPFVDGLKVCAPGVTLRGLALAGLLSPIATVDNSCGGPPLNLTVTGNYIGLRADGSATSADNDGIMLGAPGAGTRIGGTLPSERNILSGRSTGSGIAFLADVVADVSIVGNYIGTDPSGLLARPNAQAGVNVRGGAQRIAIGGSTAGQANRIAFNTGAGIIVADNTTRRITFFGNDVFGNGILGADLGADGNSINDFNDADVGPNDTQNAPELVSVAATEGLVVEGTLDVPAATSAAPYTIALYENAECDPSLTGEGEIFLGAQVVNLSGNAEDFSVDLVIPRPAAGRVITATATDPEGNTSEFSSCIDVPVGPEVFSDGFED